MSIRPIKKARLGGIKALVGLFLLSAALIAGLFLNGSLNQQKQEELVKSAYEKFSQNYYEGALKLFQQSREAFTFTLKVYRVFKRNEDYLNSSDIDEILVSTCLAAAYDGFFTLEPEKKWVEKAQKFLQSIPDSERKPQLARLVETADNVAKLCADYAAGDIEKAFKELKSVEQKSVEGDADFFLFEIRFLIACGKALEEPLIIDQARELLFFATTEAGINNEKTQKLWGILTN